jgi:hypothetical protein
MMASRRYRSTLVGATHPSPPQNPRHPSSARRDLPATGEDPPDPDVPAAAGAARRPSRPLRRFRSPAPRSPTRALPRTINSTNSPEWSRYNLLLPPSYSLANFTLARLFIPVRAHCRIFLLTKGRRSTSLLKVPLVTFLKPLGCSALPESNLSAHLAALLSLLLHLSVSNPTSQSHAGYMNSLMIFVFQHNARDLFELQCNSSTLSKKFILHFVLLQNSRTYVHVHVWTHARSHRNAPA